MMRRLTKVSALAALAALVLAGCQTVKQPTTQTTPAGPSATPVAEGKPVPGFTPANFGRLPVSDAPDWDNARKAFRRSCASRSFASSPLWSTACENARAAVSAPEFFQQNFDLWAVSSDQKANGATVSSDTTGLMTGYYEPILDASPTRTSHYTWPVLATPPDLIDVELSSLYPELKGKRIRGKISGRKLIPYGSRSSIDQRTDLYPYAIAWLADPIDQLFLQIQGSGQLRVKGVGLIRVFYDDQNGYPYRAVARWLIDRNQMTAHEASMQSIRAWAKAHPDQVPQLLAYNPSYVFFRRAPVTDLSVGPQGGQGVPLTPGASVAIDRHFWVYGTPFFVSVSQQNPDLHFNRPVIAQDTGGAIRGIIRFDYFWGSGNQAGENAGRQKSTVTAWVMVPKGHSPAEVLRK